MKPAPQGEAIARVTRDLIATSSLEINADRSGEARDVAALVPAGTAVYVNHLPRYTTEQMVAALVGAREAGLEPVPHLAARRIASRRDAQMFLTDAVRNAGIRRILLIGGDELNPRGPYPDAASLLCEGSIADSGVREVGFATYPEGHPRIPRAGLERALDEKLALANAQGLSSYLVTQFSFAPARVIEHLSELNRWRASVPVYVGIAGPTEPLALLRYAQRCGVSNSLRALRAQGFGAARLVMHTDPAEQIAAVARYSRSHAAACNVVGVHLFSFGGVVKTAEWINSVLISAQ
ncbi:MAG TPA: hypothetical protein VNE58_18480 [Casimicrobiaceae bacterium]|nr:hypothetical protein [Casimicrobiaceae bacterium]